MTVGAIETPGAILTSYCASIAPGRTEGGKISGDPLCCAAAP
jgi:hypothetical protein